MRRPTDASRERSWPGSARVATGALLLASALAGGACGGGGPAPTPAPAPDAPPRTAPVEEPPPLRLAPAPWSGPALRSGSVPSPYLAAWRSAENRESCGLLAFHDPPAGRGDVEPQVRTARFGGGWGVAYDLPGLRSAFGVAGTGAEPGPDTYDDWPHRREWRDGSRAGWGPEGGSGPKQLAYLRVAGERCLYNVWSRFGPEHLEALLESLRRVET